MLSEIQKKTKEEKRKIAYMTTFVIGVMIFSIWMLMTSYNIKQAINVQDVQNDGRVMANVRQSLPTIKQTDSVTTELVKQRKEVDENSVEEESTETKKKSLFEKLFR